MIFSREDMIASNIPNHVSITITLDAISIEQYAKNFKYSVGENNPTIIDSLEGSQLTVPKPAYNPFQMPKTSAMTRMILVSNTSFRNVSLIDV